MKHTRIIAALLTVLTLASCTGTSTEQGSDPAHTTETVPASDYFVVNLSKPGDVYEYAYKINSNTGTYVNICPDPVCKHDSPECPFYDAGWNYQVYGDYFYYRRDRTGGFSVAVAPGVDYEPPFSEDQSGLFRLNMTLGTNEKLIPYDKDHPDDFASNYYYPSEKYLFYYKIRVTEAESVSVAPHVFSEDGEPEYETTLCRLEYDSGEIKELETFQQEPSGCPRPKTFKESTVEWNYFGKLVVTDYDFNIISEDETLGKKRTTPDGEGRIVTYNGRDFIMRDTDADYGEYKFKGGKKTARGAGASGVIDFYLYDSESGKETLIIKEGLGMPLYIEEKDIFVYMKPHKWTEENTLYAGELSTDGLALYDKAEGEIWRVNADGTDERFICKVEDPYLDNSVLGDFLRVSHTKSYTNNSVILEMWHYGLDTSGYTDPVTEEYLPIITVLDKLNGYAIVNVDTGEYKVVYPDGDPQTCAARDISAEIKLQSK